MTLIPILNAPFIIQLHVLAAVCAVVLGPLTLWRRSRDKWHKRLGYAWVMAMLATAVSSFWIMDIRIIGPFSPIHGISAFTIWSLWQGVNAARQGRIAAHRQTMQSLYFWAMGVAGLFTFLPGRRMNDVFFENAPMLGFVVMACLIGSGLAWSVYAGRKAGPGDFGVQRPGHEPS